jgi:hypothetical protein
MTTSSGTPVSSEQARSLDDSARTTGSGGSASSPLLPCQWKIVVTVESKATFFPDNVSVYFDGVSQVEDHHVERTPMIAATSPEVAYVGRLSPTYSVTAGATKWKCVAAQTQAVAPRPEPYRVTVEIKPEKPWVAVHFVDTADKAVKDMRFNLKLGDATRQGTSAEKAVTVMDLRTRQAVDSQSSVESDATKCDIASVEHADVWELVSVTTT